jgi:hypothetical protein
MATFGPGDPEFEAARRAGLVPGLAGAPYTAPLEPQPDSLPVNPAAPSGPMARYDAIPPPLPGAGAAGAAPEAPAPPVDPLAAMKAVAAVGPDVKSTTVVPTKAFQALRGQMNELDKERQQTADQQTKHNVEVAKETAKLEGQVQTDQRALETQLAADRARIDSQKAAAVAYEKKLRDANAKDYERGFFEERGTAKSLGIALSVGLGALGQGLAQVGGVKIDNYAWDITAKAMDQYAAREKGRLLRQKEEIERAGGDVSRVDQQLRDFDTITRPHREAALIKDFEQRRRALLANHGANEKQIEGDAVRQRLKQEQLSREAGLEQALFRRVESDNTEQNKARRALAAGQAGGTGATDLPDEKLTQETRKAQAVINGAMTATKEAAKHQYTAKDRRIVDEMVGAARNVDPSDPTKFWAAMNQLKGKHYSQLSEAGKRRFDSFFRAGQDLERITSGGVIGTHEIADFLSGSKTAGSERQIIQRARDMLPATGQPNKVAARISGVEQELGLQPGLAVASAPADKRQMVQNAAQAQTLLRTTQDQRARAALEAILKNPGDPRAGAVLAKLQGR